MCNMYQNEGESGGNRIACDKYDVGKVNVETSTVLSQQDKGRSFPDYSGIQYRKQGDHKASPGIRQNKAFASQGLRRFYILVDHIQSISQHSLCPHRRRSLFYLRELHQTGLFRISQLKLMTTGVMMMMIVIIPCISDEGTGTKGIVYTRSKGMKMNASSPILLCQISDTNERKTVETSSRVPKKPRRKPQTACLMHTT